MTRFVLAGFLVACEILAGAPVSAEDAAATAATAPEARTTPVTRQEVWQAVVAELHERGFPEPQLPRIEDLDLPVALPALAGRKLRVLSACWDQGPRRTQFRLECGEPGACLPFFAYVHDVPVHEGSADSDADAGAAVRAEACRPAAEPRLAPEAAPKPSPAKPAVRPGDRATAVFVSDRLRITARVTCLDRGREGEVIRVRGEEGQVFRARISGPALLEAVPQ